MRSYFNNWAATKTLILMPEKQADPSDQIRILNRQLDSAYQNINAISGELVFWKKLALHQLGVDKEKVNELVHSGYGLVGGSSLNSGVTSSGY